MSTGPLKVTENTSTPSIAAAGSASDGSLVVATWPLKTTIGSAPKIDKILDYRSSNSESVFQPDKRTLVPPADFGPKGKYRSVVKLFVQYARQEQGPDAPWAIGTGWLIKDDLIATAGHNAYDWKYSYGPVIRVKAYIGYYGKHAVDDPSVQFRTVSRVTTTVGWLTSRDNRSNDLSFMQLESPFTGVTPYKFSDTPMSGNEKLGVVGFPGDKISSLTGERGDRMYEEFKIISYGREKSEQHMLEYDISTYGGNSGAPVLRASDMSSLGVHVYGGDRNSASCIGPQYGNPFLPYIGTFTQDKLESTARPGSVKEQATFLEFYNVKSTPKEESLFEPGEEGFLDIIGKALSIGADVVGTIGGPIGVLAGTGLSAAAALATNLAAESGGLDDVGLQNSGIIERALLQDAAFHAVWNMDPKSRQALGIEEGMIDVATSLFPKVKALAPVLLDVITGPALNVALSTIESNSNKKPESGFTFLPRELGGLQFNNIPIQDPNISESFINIMLQPTVEVGDAEGFFDTLGPIIQKGLRVAKPIVKVMAAAGVDGVIKQLQDVKENLGQKAPASLDGAVQRAVMGAAALDALQKVDPAKLQEEGIFDTIKAIAQKVGPVVMKHGPAVIDGVVSLVNTVTTSKASNHGLSQDEVHHADAGTVTSHQAPSGLQSLTLERQRIVEDDGPFFVLSRDVPQ